MTKIALTPADIFARLRAAGWRLLPTSRGHTKCLSPSGAIVLASFGQAQNRRGQCPHALRNFLADLKRYAGWTP